MARPGAASERRSRRIVRASTFIAPATGERVKRNFTLRGALRHDQESGDYEREPLLGSHGVGIDDDRSWGFSQHARRYANDIIKFWRSTTGQGIFKCSLAYLLGTMATFVPPIAALIGKQDSKHMVATVTVYFHPARTIGSMHEATILALIAFAYAAFLSFSSMGLSMFLGRLDLLQLGHAIDLLIFCGAGLGLIAWIKQYFNHPLVNVACSLASLGSITTLVKEGSIQTGKFSEDKVAQIMIMVIMGVAVTMLVNIAVLPIRARRRLHKDLVKSTDLMGEMLISTTRAFLLGEEDVLSEGKQTISDHETAASSMKSNLIEAKREHYVLGTERTYYVEAKLVNCLDRLAQDLGGLRSAASTQFAILSKAMDGPDHEHDHSSSKTIPRSMKIGTGSLPRRDSVSRSSMLDVIREDPGEACEGDESMFSSSWTSPEWSPNRSWHADSAVSQSLANSQNVGSAGPSLTPAEMFVTFINHLGPPAKSLAYTLKQILDNLQFDRDGSVSVNDHFSDSLHQAVDMYKRSRTTALESLYKSRAVSGEKSADVLADMEEVAASCGHFSFALLNFAEDASSYLSLLDELRAELQRSPKARSWHWMKFWRHRHHNAAENDTPGLAHNHLESGDPVGDIALSVKRAGKDAQPPLQPESDRPWYYPVYRATRILQRDDVRFAIKVGIGAALYALPAYLPSTRPFFTHWRGEWGLVSYMVVCSMTIGASNSTGLSRFLGTLIGAALAILAWLISNKGGVANPYLLAFLGWLVSLACFYIIIAQKNGPMGRFILLTYNLGALYAYSLSVLDVDNGDDEGGIDPAIWSIVLHRVVAVIVGCLWGVIVTRLIWPISARQKLKDGLCVLWLRMSLIWKRDPLRLILLGQPTSTYMDIREEAELQTFLAYLDSLRKSAAAEFELQGPFPDELMKRIIERTKKMLEAFHAMNVVISKNLRATAGEAAVLRYTREERFALSARISHLFSVLSSSLKLEYPLNDVLPNIEDRRDRLLAKVFEFRRGQTSGGRGDEGNDGGGVEEADLEVIYAYVLVTGQLADDLSAVRHDLESLFGTLDEEHLKLQ